MDRFSNIPIDLIYEIISLLSTDDVASLQYASKKFKSLVSVIPNIAFESSEIRGCLIYFVSGILARPESHRVRRLSLKLRYLNFDSSRWNLVNECLINVLKRGVMDLELDINVKEDYKLPSEMFTCKSVVKMKLGSGFVIDMIPENALLPSLNTLILDSVRFVDLDGCAFQKLISACPVLKELVIDHLNWEKWKWCRVLSSKSLERFTTRRNVLEEEEEYVHSDSELLSIDTPSLVYLEYYDVLLRGYPLVSLNSLVEAKLYLPELYIAPNPHLTNLIKGLKNVQKLHLDFFETVPIFGVFHEAVPVFENMTHLSVAALRDTCWEGLQVILKKSPNLKDLTINGTLHYDEDLENVCECLLGYSFLLTCPIEVLKITMFQGDIGEMVQIEHVLEKLPCLKLLELHAQARGEYKKQEIIEFIEDLRMLPRASSKCKVEIKFS